MAPEEQEMRKTLKASLVADPIVDPKTEILNFTVNPNVDSHVPLTAPCRGHRVPVTHLMQSRFTVIKYDTFPGHGAADVTGVCEDRPGERGGHSRLYQLTLGSNGVSSRCNNG